MTYDSQKKRPLELRVRDMTGTGGITDANATRLGRLAGDGFFIIRVMDEADGQAALSVSTLYGASGEPFGVDGLWLMWLALARKLAATPPRDPEAAKRTVFVQRMLGLFNLWAPEVATSTPEGNSSSADAPAPSTD